MATETVETKSKTKKLNTEDLNAINDLRTKFNDLYSTLGLLTIDENILTSQLENVKNQITEKMSQFDELRNLEEQLILQLKNQYGDGQISIVDGTFTAAE